MMKKTIITGMIIFSLLAAVTFTAEAADETQILNDDVGDVYDINDESEHPEIQDIDIEKITYSKDDDQASIEFDFVDILNESDDIEFVILLITNQDTYMATYSYGVADGIRYSDYSTVDITLTGFGTDKVMLSFVLTDDSEKYISMTAYIDKIVGEDVYEDVLSDLDALLEVIIDAPSTGKVGQEIDFSASATSGAAPFEWEWDFDEDGETDAYEQNPSFTYETPGTYNVTVYVFDSQYKSGLNITIIEIEAGSDDSSQGSGLTLFIALIVIIVIIGLAVLFYVIRK